MSISNYFRWIKASERLPKIPGAYWCKLNDGLESKNGVYFNGTEWETYKGQFILQWLEELPSNSVEAEAVEFKLFLKFIGSKNWYVDEDGRIWQDAFSGGAQIEFDDAYSLFKQSKQ